MGQPNRREFLASLAAASTSGTLSVTQRPNIVFVLTDDQGYGDLACHGNPLVKTPNLDRMYEQSVRLTDFHVSPTCAPTRCSLMTGRHEFKAGVTHTILERERMSLKATTMGQVLQAAGYATAIFGKWHLGDAAAYQPGQRGFDEVFIHGCGGIGQDYGGTCSDAPGNTYFNPTILHNGVFERTSGYCTDVFFAQALRWMEQRRKIATPFFAYIATNAPHVPLFCPEEYQRMYQGRGLGDDLEKYFGMVTNIDDNVGHLMSRLTDWGLDKNTLLVFMTDNGGTTGVRFFDAGMRGAKGTPFRGGTRVPAFFRWTGTLQARDEDKLTGHIDVLPTFAEVARAQLPGGLSLDGRSFLPLLKDGSAEWADRYVFTHVGRWDTGQAAAAQYAGCCIRSERYSLVNVRTEKSWELYDIKADPGEKTNIAGQHPAEVQKMDAAYQQWWAEVLPCFENERAVPPDVAPYKELYWKQFGGGPGFAMPKRG